MADSTPATPPIGKPVAAPLPAPTAASSTPAVKGPTLAQAAQPAPVKVNPGKKARVSNKSPMQLWTVPGLKGAVADLQKQIPVLDLPDPEKVYLLARLATIPATAVAIDFHAYVRGGHVVTHLHITKLY